jgi:hypothetical protein
MRVGSNVSNGVGSLVGRGVGSPVASAMAVEVD